MLHSRVPVCLCSIAIIITIPPTANTTRSLWASGTTAFYPAGKSILKKERNVLTLPDKQGMKFVRVYLKNNDEELLIVKQRSEAPFMIIDSVLDHYHLPLELKYLAVIESDLKTSAVSRVGAKGPWQLMPATAHVLGLKVSRRADERINYYKSTRAAAKYLRDLHGEFGDWLLVLAAYNGGPRPVIRAIRKAHSRNFWVLQRYLPAESRNHVKRFIATAYYFEGAGNVNNGNTNNLSDAGGTASPSYAGNANPSYTGNANASYARNKTGEIHESANDRFMRLMKESARSLQSSNELLDTGNGYRIPLL